MSKEASSTPVLLERTVESMQPVEEGGSDVSSADAVRSACEKLRGEMARAIVGQEEVVELLLIALLARGHALFEGVPGLAKTLLIRSLAAATSCSFSRIQFTPDLLPSDITGTEVFQDDPAGGQRRSVFVQGPVFANLVLADEINRTPPKTQAALLEAMQEREVTVLGRTMALPTPFAVFATQNPIEHEGTYPLPEAQLDRFMFQVEVPYPQADQELEIVERTTTEEDIELTGQVSAEELVALQEVVRTVPAGRETVAFAVELVRSSRPGPDAPDFVNRWISWGAGPRASQYLVLAAKARALMDGRFAVAKEDIKALARPVLSHRILRNFKAEAEGVTTGQLVDMLLDSLDRPADL